MKLNGRAVRNILNVVFLSLGLSLIAQAQPISIGLLPSGQMESRKAQAFILAQKLQDKINKPVQIFISKDYKGLIEALKDKKVDFAFLSAMTFVESEKQTDLKVLLKKTWEGPYYYASLISTKKSGIKKLSEIKNKRIVFVDENSTSGFLYPQVYLRKNKFLNSSFKSVTFSGSHAESIALLESGKADVAAVFSDDEGGAKGAWTRFSKDKTTKYNILWTSLPIPNDPIVVRTEYYEANQKLSHEIMYAFIEFQADKTIKPQVEEILGHGDLVPATTGQYDPVREMVNSLKTSTK